MCWSDDAVNPRLGDTFRTVTKANSDSRGLTWHGLCVDALWPSGPGCAHCYAKTFAERWRRSDLDR